MTKRKVNPVFLFLVLTVFCFFAGCASHEESAATEEVIFDDAIKTGSKQEVVISDQDFSEQKALSDASRQPMNFSKNGPDGSKIDTATDKFGNKNETRCFNSSRIKCLRLSTFPDGRREALVFGHNGQTKNLPEEMLDRALTASADEIADSVRIYAAFKATRSGL